MKIEGGWEFIRGGLLIVGEAFLTTKTQGHKVSLSVTTPPFIQYII